VCAVEDNTMSLINPIGVKRPIGLPESTGVLSAKPKEPIFTASIFSSPGISRGGTETTGVNSYNSGCAGANLNVMI